MPTLKNELTPRRYAAIWEELKANRVCTVQAHSSVHKRIKRMVIKEKYRDKAFRQAWLDTPTSIRQEPDTLVVLLYDSYMVFKLMPLSHAVAAGYRKLKYTLSSI